jgi:hypothetical protein
MPTDPYGPRKATVKPDLKSARKGQCAVCQGQRTVYPARVFPADRPWEELLMCSDCVARLQRVGQWPLPPE